MVTKYIFDALAKNRPATKTKSYYFGKEGKRAKNFTGHRSIGRVGRYKGKTK
jgi:hypothetical protein